MALAAHVTRRTVRFSRPVTTAFGELHERELFELELTGPEGITGRGEAVPLEPYDGVSPEAVEDALTRYAEALAAEPADANAPPLLHACRALADLPCALAAVDMALWDRAGRRAGKPVAALLTDAYDEQV